MNVDITESVHNVTNTSVCSGPHENGAFFHSALLSYNQALLILVSICWDNWPYQKHWRSVTLVGCGFLLMAWTLSPTVLSPSDVKVVPKKAACFVLKCSLSMFSFIVQYLVTCMNFIRYLLWSLPSTSLPLIIISSAMPLQKSKLIKVVSSMAGMLFLWNQSKGHYCKSKSSKWWTGIGQEWASFLKLNLVIAFAEIHSCKHHNMWKISFMSHFLAAIPNVPWFLTPTLLCCYTQLDSPRYVCMAHRFYTWKLD